MKKIIPKIKEEAKPAIRKEKTKKARLVKKTKDIAQAQIIGLHNLKAPFGSHKKKKLLGRGSGSGHGKTSTRGSKGQTSRAGRHFYLGFEGGQSPLIRRMPKRGFNNPFGKDYQIVNLRDLKGIKESNITLELLEQKGLIKNKKKLVKILGVGQVTAPVTVQAHAFSKKASTEIKNAGGKTEIIPLNV